MTITTNYPALTVGATDPQAPSLIQRPRISRVEWACHWCARSGAGFMPEHHASGACSEVTKTAVMAPPGGFVDGGGI
jgi:hypothetical protein